MRYLPEDKILLVNKIAAAICKRTCVARKCGLCQLFNLKSGIDSVLGSGRPVDTVIQEIVTVHKMTIDNSNADYDRRYELHK